MRSPLPRNAPPSSRARRLARRALVLASFLVLSLAREGHSLEVTLDPPRQAGDHVWVDLHLSDVLSPRVEESLSRGMPATLRFHAELWRKRTAWFDPLEQSFDASLKIRYEVWSGTYRIEGRGRAPLALTTLDSVRMALSRPLALPAGTIGLMKPEARYYVVLSVTLKPLSVEDLEEGEGWLSGEVENKRHAGVGVLTAIPRSVFDAVRNFAGFGDEHARAISEPFERESLDR